MNRSRTDGVLYREYEHADPTRHSEQIRTYAAPAQ